MIDIPAGLATIVVAVIVAVSTIVAAFIARRWGRMARLERENRQLWFALRGVVDVLYKKGLPIPTYLEEIINPPLPDGTKE